MYITHRPLKGLGYDTHGRKTDMWIYGKVEIKKPFFGGGGGVWRGLVYVLNEDCSVGL
jgi:hypothetical protein